MTRPVLAPVHVPSPLRRIFWVPLNGRASFRRQLLHNRPVSPFPPSLQQLPLWARGANRRRARRWLPITTRTHERMILEGP